MNLCKLLLIAFCVFSLESRSGAISTSSDPDLNDKKKLTDLVGNKNLVLSSRPEFIVPGEQMYGRNVFLRMNVLASNAIKQFGFTATLERPDFQPSVMKVVANKSDASIMVQDIKNNVYCVMANGLFIVCDPHAPGGLAYHEGGSFIFGLFQSPNPENMQMKQDQMDFKLAFDTMDGISAVLLDVDYIIQRALNVSSNVVYNANTRTAVCAGPKTILEIQLAEDIATAPFGIESLIMSLQGGITFNFSAFETGTVATHGLVRFSVQDLKNIHIPLRAMDADEFSRCLKYIPNDFPSSPEEKMASDKLKQLIGSLAKTEVSNP